MILLQFSPGVANLGMGRYHMCALLTSDSVECWGDNGYGQLGTGDTTNRLTPTMVSGLSGEPEVE